jgi:hypothetical protein
MSDFFYDGQVRRFLTQFIRVMSNFSYKDAKGNLTQVPVRYGDMTRQVAQIVSKNSENVVQSAPFISCYIKDIQFDRERVQDPTFIDSIQIRERATTPDGTEYYNAQGKNYTVERIMPSPYKVTFNADLWTTNTEQKLQLWEQIVVLFNPALEIQSSDNYLDWTSLSYLEISSMTFESRSIPQGLESDISVCSLSFTSPIWITPPAKVKQMGIITKIIANIYAEPTGSLAEAPYSTYGGLIDLFDGQTPTARTTVTPGNFDLLVLDNTATLLPIKDPAIYDGLTSPSSVHSIQWQTLLDIYPGEFKAGLSQIRLTTPSGGQIVAFVSLNPLNDFALNLNFDVDTIPSNTVIAGRGTIDAIINPITFNPGVLKANTRYLILEDIPPEAHAWRNADSTQFTANANDIIQTNGTNWSVIFNSAQTTEATYITNTYTGIQYKWDGEQWTKSFEGVYDRGAWSLVL